MKGVIWLAIPVMLAGCDLVQDRYRMEFRDGSWREIAISPFSNEARWREGCATGEIQVDIYVPPSTTPLQLLTPPGQLKKMFTVRLAE